MNRTIEKGVIPGEVAGYHYFGSWQIIVARSAFHNHVTATAKYGRWEDGYFRHSLMHDPAYYNFKSFDAAPVEANIHVMLNEAITLFLTMQYQNSVWGKLDARADQERNDLHASIDERFDQLRKETDENWGIFAERYRCGKRFTMEGHQPGFNKFTRAWYEMIFKLIQGVTSVSIASDDTYIVIHTRNYRWHQLIEELIIEVQDVWEACRMIGMQYSGTVTIVPVARVGFNARIEIQLNP